MALAKLLSELIFLHLMGVVKKHEETYKRALWAIVHFNNCNLMGTAGYQRLCSELVVDWHVVVAKAQSGILSQKRPALRTRKLSGPQAGTLSTSPR